MPQITASIEQTEQILPLDVSFDLTLNDLGAYIGAELGEETNNLIIQHAGKGLTAEQGTQTLNQLGFQPEDIILVTTKSYNQQVQGDQNQQPPGLSQDHAMKLEMLRQDLLQNPQMVQQISSFSPRIANDLHDPIRFAESIRPLVDAGMLDLVPAQQRGGYPGGATQEEWERLQRTKDTPESQKRIKDLEDLEYNFEMAMEETPELFGSITMLYVALEVNGHPVKAFVDSGAQATIMSPKMIDKCELTHLVDKRFKGMAQGVGTSEILGRVLVAPMSISGSYLPVSLSVMDAGVDMLLGLDMLRRHQASIDLKRNVLVIGDVEAPFLPESEIPQGMFNPSPALDAGHLLGSSTLAAPSGSRSSAPSSTAATTAAAAAASRRAQLNSSSTAQSAVAATSAATSGASSFPESDISSLISLGFSRSEAIRALEMAGGNAEVAASFLFQ